MTSPIRVLYTHPDFLVTIKPADLSFHTEDDALGLVAQIKNELNTGPLFPVHRLDHITSGLTLFARNADAARELGQMFAAGEIAKFYLAISDRKPAKKQGAIKGSMIKGRNGSWRLAETGGSFAMTQFFSYGLGDGLRLFVVRPRTGRTHQIRVALKSLGAPILGDLRYGGSAADRGYLHAWALHFDWHGESQQFICHPDEGSAYQNASVQTVLQEIETPWSLPWPQWQKPKLLPDNG